MIRRTLLLILLSLIASSTAFTQSASAIKFRVALKISGDAAIASEIESCIKEELSSLNNVEAI
jgi:hypothetical protein